GRPLAIEGGALAGLLKSIRRECKGLFVKVIDAPPEESTDSLAAAVCAEWAGKFPGVEVGYVRGRRRVVRAIPRPLAGLEKPQEIAGGSVWVATGGVTGIVGIVARELGRRFDLKLHLIGRTAAPGPDGAWRHLSESALKELK